MADLRRVPSGRAGRLWLTARLHTAQRAGALLDRKLRLLRAEQERFTLLSQQTGEAWAAAQRISDQWLARAAALGGDRGVALATIGPQAAVDIQWETVMGLRYPASVRWHTPEPDLMAMPDGTAALTEARRASQAALAAAVAHAAASTARRIIDRETTATRQRLHAITDRWTPRLERALADLTQQLEEAERAETVRLRWALNRQDTTDEVT